jgi:hypothetical protein
MVGFLGSEKTCVNRIRGGYYFPEIVSSQGLACNRLQHGGIDFEGGVAKWQQWRRADMDRLAGKHCGDRLRSDMLFSLAVAGRFFWPGLPSCSRCFPLVSARSMKPAIAGVTDPGAPVAPRIVDKAKWTTLSSLAVFAALVAVADHAG